MTLRQTLKHIKSAVRIVWFSLRHWRQLWTIHTQIQENEPLQDLEELNQEVYHCEECRKTGECEHHRERFEELKDEMESESWGPQ